MPPTSRRRWARPLCGEDLGAFLAEVRIERGLTQDELADDLGINRRYLYAIESGKPSLYVDRLFALLAALDVRLLAEADIDRGADLDVDPGIEDVAGADPPDSVDVP